MKAAAELDLDATWEMDDFEARRLPRPSAGAMVILETEGNIEGFHLPGDTRFERFALAFTRDRRPSSYPSARP